MDPYCSWCYAGSENVLRLYIQYKNILPFEVVPAGMLTGEHTMEQLPEHAEATIRQLKNVEKQTGARFGEAHHSSLRNQQMLMDSEIPCRAVIACRQVAPSSEIPFVHALLHARFNRGMNLNEPSTYLELCEVLDIDKQAFFQAFTSEESKEQTQKSFDQADKLADTYPTLLYVDDDMTVRLEEGYEPFEILQLRIERILKGEITGMEERLEDDNP